jgi:D-sedoheptulose 7-phosphate isomerase
MTDDAELDFIRRYTSDVSCLLRQLDPGPIMAAITALHGAWETGKPVLFCGNGGSGASCSHIVNDLQKCVGLETGKPLRALCLSDCAPLVSAWANDSSWANVFAPQVATWGEAGGVLVAVSGSGNSANVLHAVREASGMRMAVVGLTGFGGGMLKQMADISLHVSTESMQQAEDVHMALLHMLFLGLLNRIKVERGSI